MKSLSTTILSLSFVSFFVDSYNTCLIFVFSTLCSFQSSPDYYMSESVLFLKNTLSIT